MGISWHPDICLSDGDVPMRVVMRFNDNGPTIENDDQKIPRLMLERKLQIRNAHELKYPSETTG